MTTPEQLFKTHCRANATFKQYETFLLGFQLGKKEGSIGSLPITSNETMASSEGSQMQLREAAIKYDNAVKAYQKVSDNYKEQETKLSDAVTLLTSIYNSLPENDPLRSDIEKYLVS